MRADAAVIGGGLGGLCLAIDLRLRGFKVVLIEKRRYPFHKVCGEYISNEVLPYLRALGVDPFAQGAVPITDVEFGSIQRKSTRVALPLGGFGISRYQLDQQLAKRAKQVGVQLILGKAVVDVRREKNFKTLVLADDTEWDAEQVIFADGKQSSLHRRIIGQKAQRRTEYVAFKTHFKASWPSELVGLYHFKSGYVGVSRVEEDRVNFCFLTTTEHAKEFARAEHWPKTSMGEIPELQRFFQESEMLLEPLAISHINFGKRPLANSALAVGDAAGLIHPLCGNGMAMAIQSAQLLAHQMERQRREAWSDKKLKGAYRRDWNRSFHRRMHFGAIMQYSFENERLMDLLWGALAGRPQLLQYLIRQSHGSALDLPHPC